MTILFAVRSMPRTGILDDHSGWQMFSDDLIAVARGHVEGVDHHLMGDVQYPFDLVFRTARDEVEAQKWHDHSPSRTLPSANRARCMAAQRASRCDQDIVGITNSAPARMP